MFQKLLELFPFEVEVLWETKQNDQKKKQMTKEIILFAYSFPLLLILIIHFFSKCWYFRIEGNGKVARLDIVHEMSEIESHRTKSTTR